MSWLDDLYDAAGLIKTTAAEPTPTGQPAEPQRDNAYHARLDRERNERDRRRHLGYDFDKTAPSHVEYAAEQGKIREAEIDRLGQSDGWDLAQGRPDPTDFAMAAALHAYDVAMAAGLGHDWAKEQAAAAYDNTLMKLLMQDEATKI